MNTSRSGFTIVELLIVIVIIGILAMITVVAYNGIQERGRIATLTTDLTAGSKQLEIDYAFNGSSYPSTLAQADSGKGLVSSPGVTLNYMSDGISYCLSATTGKTSYKITDEVTAIAGGCVNVAKNAASPSSILTNEVITTNPYYSTGTGLQSVTVNLGSQKDVSMVKVWHYFSDGRTYNATKTEVSTNGTTWKTVFDSATAGTYPETSYGRTTTFPLQKVQYIRDWLNGSTANTSNHWVEIQAF